MPCLSVRKERNLTAHIFCTKMFHVEQNQEREEGMFHVEHKKKKDSGRSKCSTWNIAQKSRKENQLKCKAKKKNRSETAKKNTARKGGIFIR